MTYKGQWILKGHHPLPWKDIKKDFHGDYTHLMPIFIFLALKE
jgi:hypothetical protein